ncbi:serine hydrolase domain-containing protein [Leeuwenhoekiella marinoflava]|uniref:serine hydrolase domain-containing protein n=1 Tax=Leeuwenhoekiella marinoflava TaxID=988 RepID=UPI003000FF8A
MKVYLNILVVLISFCTVAQTPVITASKQQEITDYLKHFEDNNALLGSLSIFEEGEEIMNHALGSVSADSETKYQIGSISKLFTAVLLAQLKEENKIDFKESLKAYFPKIPGAEEIELVNLLNHTSGLQDFVVKQDSIYFWLKKPVKQEEILDEIVRQGPAFKPGDSVRYSNAGYYLLARILEQKYKKPYEEILAEKIAKPLGLKNTFSLSGKTTYENTAISYEKKDSIWVPVEEFYFPNVQGVGDIISTVYDLNSFMNALFSNTILKAETLEMMLPKDTDWFGMGVMKVPFYNYIAYGHGGDTYGTHSVTSYNPENQLGITYVINGEGYPTNNFAIGLLSIIYDKDYTLPELKTYIPNPSFYKTYAGTYTSSELPIAITIFQKEDTLMAQGEGQSAFELTPKSKHVFEYLKAGIHITFDPYAETFIFKQGGQEFQLKKE